MFSDPARNPASISYALPEGAATALEPEQGDIGRPYYLARTSLDALALLEPPPGQDGPAGDSN